MAEQLRLQLQPNPPPAELFNSDKPRPRHSSLRRVAPSTLVLPPLQVSQPRQECFSSAGQPLHPLLPTPLVQRRPLQLLEPRLLLPLLSEPQRRPLEARRQASEPLHRRPLREEICSRSELETTNSALDNLRGNMRQQEETENKIYNIFYFS